MTSRRTSSQIPDVDKYTESVLSGERPAGKLIKLVLQRFLDDLARQDDPAFPFYFDLEAALRPIEFIEEHITTSESHERIHLLPWQKTWIAMLFGWKRKSNNLRRYRKTFLCVAKKNGKTALSAALALYCLIADNEESARVYIAATTSKQARNCLKEAAIMRKKSPFLRKFVTQTGGKKEEGSVLALSVQRTSSQLSVMARDIKGEDGAIVSHSILDEVHRWDTKQGLYMALEYGGRSRRQPLMIEISTVGDSQVEGSPCWEEFEYGMRCLDPHSDTEDDTYLPFLFVMDEEDDWQDKKNWYKSNPSVGPASEGYIFDIDVLELEYARAKAKPGERTIFRRYALNMWGQGDDQSAIEMELWHDCCRVDINSFPSARELREQTMKEMEGRRAFGALDPSQSGDTSALSLIFPPLIEGEKFRTLEFFWLPKDGIREKSEKEKVDYERWAEEGFLTLTPGRTIDKRVMARDILALAKRFDIRDIWYDAAHASELISILHDEGFDKVTEYPQTRIKMSEPCHNWVQRIERQEIAHDNNPMMYWQVGNLIWNRSSVNPDEIMPDKRKGREKIDGCVAQIMALACATSPANSLKSKKTFKIFFPGE